MLTCTVLSRTDAVVVFTRVAQRVELVGDGIRLVFVHELHKRLLRGFRITSTVGV
jgi:hypothetical protein